MRHNHATLNISRAKPNWVFVIALLLLAGAGPIVLLNNTRWGIGLSPDSAMYIGASRGLLAGRGFSMRVADGKYNPVTNYMPVYPVAIAATSKLGPQPLEAARIVQAILLAVNVALVGLIIYYATHGASLAALIGAGLTLIAPDILWIHSFAWSEAMFLPFVIGAAALIARYVERPSIGALIGAGALLGLGYLTRYMGVAFVAAGAVAIVLLGGKPLRQRILDAAIMGATAGVPLIAWMLRNRLLGHASVGRPMVWHPVTVDHLLTGLSTLGEWFAPPAAQTAIAWICAAVAGIIGAAVTWRVRTGPSKMSSRSALPAVTGIFAIVYIILTLIGISLFDFETQMNARIFSPLLICAIVSGCILAQSGGRIPRTIAVSVCAAIIVQWAFASNSLLLQLRTAGLGYGAPRWLQSPTLAAVHRLPKNTLIYSNAWDVISLLENRHAETLPSHDLLLTGRSNPEFDRQMKNIEEEVEKNGAVIVLFNNMKSRPTLPTDRELRSKMPLRTLYRRDDGIVYTAAQP